MLPPSCFFHSVFLFIRLFLTCSRSWISEYVLESGRIMQRCSLSLSFSLSVSVSFHLSFFCFLLSFLPERKERHRVIGFPLIARVMLTVHKSCHWNSTSFIFRFCLGFFVCLFSTSSSSSHLVLQCELSRHASYLSLPPAFVFPGVSLGGFNCLDGPSVGYCVST